MTLRRKFCCVYGVVHWSPRGEKDIERLRQIALLQQSQLERLIAVLARKWAELEKLKGPDGELQQTLNPLEQAQKQVAETKADKGGRSDEAGLLGEKEGRPQHGHGPTEQRDLERVPLRCELDEADRACPSCGGRLEPLAGQFERSEMIDVVDIKYQVVEVERQKYVCRSGSAVETAPEPDRAVDGGRYSQRLGVKVAYDVYLAHAPLERQTRLMAHRG